MINFKKHWWIILICVILLIFVVSAVTSANVRRNYNETLSSIPLSCGDTVTLLPKGRVNVTKNQHHTGAAGAGGSANLVNQAMAQAASNPSATNTAAAVVDAATTTQVAKTQVFG